MKAQAAIQELSVQWSREHAQGWTVGFRSQDGFETRKISMNRGEAIIEILTPTGYKCLIHLNLDKADSYGVTYY